MPETPDHPPIRLKFDTHSDDLMGLTVVHPDIDPSAPEWRRDANGEALDEFEVSSDANDRGGVAVTTGDGTFYVVGQFCAHGGWELRVVFGPPRFDPAEDPSLSECRSWIGKPIATVYEPDRYKAKLDVLLDYEPADLGVRRLTASEIEELDG